MPPNLKWAKITLKSFAELGLLPRGEPREGHDNDNRVDRHRAHAPRVRGGRGDDREIDRADDRDQEDRPDGEDDE